MRVRHHRTYAALVAASALVGTTAAPLAAQTVRGTLVDTGTGLGIPYGLVIMFHESGDSVTATVGDERGAFSLTAPEPGSFLLLAGALGYHETPAGVFELGRDGVVTVRYGLSPRPLPLDELVVSLDRPTLEHHLVRRGYVRRFQRGLGVFVTPYMIERSAARSTEQLVAGLPGIRVGSAYSAPRPGPGIQVGIPLSHLGEAITVNGPRGWCLPRLFVDGLPTVYDPDSGQTLSAVAGIGEIEALEVYRRPAEIPVEYDPGPSSNCGVIVAWTKTGLAPGQQPSGRRTEDPAARLLPSVGTRGAPPTPGERVRMQLTTERARSTGLGSPWDAEFVRMEEADLVAADRVTGRLHAVPRPDVEAIQVRRSRDRGFVRVRAATAGAAAAAGTWGGLTLLCAWSNCEADALNRWIPSLGAAILASWLVHRQGPGHHWVETTLPEVGSGPTDGAVSLSWALDSPRGSR